MVLLHHITADTSAWNITFLNPRCFQLCWQQCTTLLIPVCWLLNSNNTSPYDVSGFVCLHQRYIRHTQCVPSLAVLKLSLLTNLHVKRSYKTVQLSTMPRRCNEKIYNFTSKNGSCATVFVAFLLLITSSNYNLINTIGLKSRNKHSM